MEISKKRHDYLKGFEQRLAGKKDHVVALQGEMVLVRESIRKWQSLSALDEESRESIAEYVNDHASAAVIDDTERADEESSEQHWLNENALRPL